VDNHSTRLNDQIQEQCYPEAITQKHFIHILLVIKLLVVKLF